MLTISSPQFLTRNESVLPVSFNKFTSLIGSGDLTISGTFQIYQTSLLGTSTNNNTNRIDNIIGVSMYNIDVDKNKLGISVNSLSISGTNYLTKNATILPSSFIIFFNKFRSYFYFKYRW